MANTSTFVDQVRLAQQEAMRVDSAMLAFGLGISDPKGIFGTTLGLTEMFGENRVFDMPTAENAMTGVGIGAALSGARVLMTHQRLDFFLLALDQLVNNAAKWSYMFNGQMRVPLTIRLIVGRGWGQGPTHAQNLQSWFAHVPGLKVIVASTADVVAQQLYQAIFDDNPCVFIEHRWLHGQQTSTTNKPDLTVPVEGTRLLRRGNSVTIVASSFLTIEALKAATFLEESGVKCDVIDLGSLHSVTWSVIEESVGKTGHLIVCDSAHPQTSFGSHVIATVGQSCLNKLKKAPVLMALPCYPEPTSWGLTEHYYPDASSITETVTELLALKNIPRLPRRVPHDVPGDYFKGPF